jgi:hypothetical protein
VALISHFSKSTQSLTWIEVSITLSHSLEHFQNFSKNLNSWLSRLEFKNENVTDLKLWLEGILNLARRWESVLRASPFELRSTILKFSPEGHIFHKYFGSDLVGYIQSPPADTVSGNAGSVAEGRAFDTLVDYQEGFVFHPSRKMLFRFSWTLEQKSQTSMLTYTVQCESPVTRRRLNEIKFAHRISWSLPTDPYIGLHSVAFSPDWDYMAIATTESQRGVKPGLQHQGNATIRVFLWKIGNFDTSGDDLLFNIPWTSSTTGDNGKSYKGYVGQEQSRSLRGSRCAVTFRRGESTAILQTGGGAWDVRTGAFMKNPAYLQGTLSGYSVSQATFSPDGLKIATVKNLYRIGNCQY